MPPLTPENAAIRAVNVTASEVGALLTNDHPYTTPADIFDRLTGGEPVEPVQNEAMEVGTFMEPAIAALAAHRFDLTIEACSDTYAHPWARLSATPDYLITDEPAAADNGPGLLEIKMSGRSDMWPARGPLPSHVEWQVRAQLACTNRLHAVVAVLVGMVLRTYTVERDIDLEARMLAAVNRFWEDHVVTGIRPEQRPIAQTFSFDADEVTQEEAIAS